MTNRRFHQLFGRPPRAPESALDEFTMDVAASIQRVVEMAMLRLAWHACEVTDCAALCLAGGVALNCVANGRLQREGPFDAVWVQPAAGDAGGAVGAALFAWHQLLENPRVPQASDAMRGSLLGPEYRQEDIEAFLESRGARFERAASEGALCDATAAELAAGKVVGWFQGRMEFGPRALGNRSILGDPRAPAMQRTMNLKIKFRESFRPFAPSVLCERGHEYFDLPRGADQPYMLFVAALHEDHRIGARPDRHHGSGIAKLDDPRSTIPAVTHVDGTARVQTVDPVRHPLYHRLLGAFAARTGCPVLVNTSFNVRGEPIVCSPEDAWRVFLATEMDVLVLGHCILKKEAQSQEAVEIRSQHLRNFAPD